MKLIYKKIISFVICISLVMFFSDIKTYSFSYDYIYENEQEEYESEQADWAGYDSYMREHNGEPDLSDGDLEQKLYPFYYEAFPEEREPDPDDIKNGIVGWDYEGNPIYKDDNSYSNNKGTDYNNPIIDHYTEANNVDFNIFGVSVKGKNSLGNNQSLSNYQTSITVSKNNDSNQLTISNINFNLCTSIIKINGLPYFNVSAYVPQYWEWIANNNNGKMNEATISASDGKFYVLCSYFNGLKNYIDENATNMINQIINDLGYQVIDIKVATTVNLNDTISLKALANNKLCNFKFIVYKNLLTVLMTYSNNTSNFNNACAEVIINNIAITES